MQANYAQLQQKYADLKEKKINDLDSLLEEHSAHLATHNETAVRLAEHWRQEAHRQAAFAQAAGAPAMQVCNHPLSCHQQHVQLRLQFSPEDSMGGSMPTARLPLHKQRGDLQLKQQTCCGKSLLK